MAEFDSWWEGQNLCSLMKRWYTWTGSAKQARLGWPFTSAYTASSPLLSIVLFKNKPSELFHNECKTKELLSGRENTKQLRNNTWERENKEHNTFQRQQLERRKLRRCKPLEAKVASWCSKWASSQSSCALTTYSITCKGHARKHMSTRYSAYDLSVKLSPWLCSHI